MRVLIEKFYSAFRRLDAEAMVTCYHDNIVFEDPAFGILKGEHAKNMWRMLCTSQKGKDFKVVATNFDFNNGKGTAQWEAFYTFSKTGRKVHNIIEAEFEFSDGKIITHKDSFDLHKWASQAMGLTGTLIGWTPYFKRKLNAQTNQLLSKFEKQLST